MTNLIHHLYHNNHLVLCPQRIFKPRGSFPWHCTKLFLTIITILQKKYPEFTHYFSCTFTAYDLIIF
jgi:hypothetical protein